MVAYEGDWKQISEQCDCHNTDASDYHQLVTIHLIEGDANVGLSASSEKATVSIALYPSGKQPTVPRRVLFVMRVLLPHPCRCSVFHTHRSSHCRRRLVRSDA